jgi:hypothetical protein
VCLASIRAGDGGLKGERSQLTRQLLHHSLHHWVSLIKNKYIMYTKGLQCFKIDVNQTGDKRYLEKLTHSHSPADPLTRQLTPSQRGPYARRVTPAFLQPPSGYTWYYNSSGSAVTAVERQVNKVILSYT